MFGGGTRLVTCDFCSSS